MTDVDVDVKVKLEPEDDTNSGSANNVKNGCRASSNRVNETRRRRCFSKTGNVIQTLFNRQLGLPSYSRSGESVCSNFNEKRIGRQLISNRAKSVDSHGENSVIPAKIKFKQAEVRQKTIQSTDWVQLELSMASKTKVGLVDGKLWKRSNDGRGGANSKFIEEFYVLDVYGLQLISRSRSIGKLKEGCSLRPRPLSTAATSTYLMTLTEPCYLRAYDVVKKRVSNELKLNLDITVPPLKHYTEVDICESKEKIFVYGATKGEIVKAILILDYPPNWSKVGIVYIDDTLKLKLNVGDGMCFIVQDKRLHLTTWAFILEKVDIISPTGKSPEASLTVKFEGRLREMPTLINTILFRTENPYALGLDMEVPLIYGTAQTGMKFFLPIHLDNLIPPPSVYEFDTAMVLEQEIEVIRFPDNSQRALIFTKFNQQYEVVTFKFELSEDGKVVKPYVSQPFNYWDELQTSRVTEPPSHSKYASLSLRRACVTKANKAIEIEKKSILGMTYCDVVNLLAVLMADEEGFMIILYDPLDLSVFKALPPVRIWQAEKNGDPNAKRVSIESVELDFEPNFIFIEFGYSNGCKPPMEVFCFRLLSESVN